MNPDHGMPAAITAANPEGPWGGELADEPLPRSPKKILALGRQHGWGFGPITMVFRMNHPDPRVSPFFVGWKYDITNSKWAFDSARDRTGHPLGVREIEAMLPLAAALPCSECGAPKTEPHAGGCTLWRTREQ